MDERTDKKVSASEEEKRPSPMRLRSAVIDSLVGGRAGFSQAFRDLCAEIKAQLASCRGRPSRLKAMVGHLDASLIAFLALRSATAMAIDADNKNGSLTVHAVAESIGAALEEEVALRQLTACRDDQDAKQVERDAARGKLRATIKARQKSASSDKTRRIIGAREYRAAITAAMDTTTEWGNKKRMEIGVDLIHILCTTTRLFERVMRAPELLPLTDPEDEPYAPTGTDHSKPRKRAMFDPTPAFWNAVADKKDHLRALSEPRFPPLKTEPKSWQTSYDGGYAVNPPLKLLKRKEENDFVRQYDNALAGTDLARVCKGVNALQCTAWTINQEVLEIIQKLRDDPSILKRFTPARPDAELPRTRNWDIAVNLNNDKPFYFAYQLDYRGRAYPLGTWLHPQGDDFARALLHFADAKAMTEDGRRWLAIHGANLMKRRHPRSPTIKERLATIEEYTDKICACARDPLKNFFWLEQGKDKHAYQFLAFCFEWANLIDAERNNGTFSSRLPVSMDGTCNGFQHFAAMLRDKELAKSTNLAPGEAPGDLYLEVANWIRETIKNDRDIGEEEKESYLEMAERKLAKKVVMIIPYGATASGIETKVRDYILENGRKQPWGKKFGLKSAWSDLDEESWKDIDRAAEYFAGQFINVMKERFPSAWKIRKWLSKCCQIVVARKMPFLWISPIGLPILQSHFKTERLKIESLSLGKQSFKCTLRKATDAVSLTLQNSAASPNFVHALDASHMLMTATAAHDRGIKSLRVIHDSYATHAADAQLLAEILRDKFCELYKDNVMAAHWEWVNAVLNCDSSKLKRSAGQSIASLVERWSRDLCQVTAFCPEPPIRGEFDVESVKKSEYFFC